MEPTPVKNCLACGNVIQGRIDKKFCDDYCRNTYNNRRNAESNKLVRTINATLKKNRNILAKLVTSENDMTKTTKQRMLDEGFKFQYFTHTYTTKKGHVYEYCYDYGYLALENGWYLIVRYKKPNNVP